MKKVIYILYTLLILTGCTLNNEEYLNEKQKTDSIMSNFNLMTVFQQIEPSIITNIDAVKDIVNSPNLNRESFPFCPCHIDTTSGGGDGSIRNPRIWSIVPDTANINLGKFEGYNHKAKGFFMGLPEYIADGDTVQIIVQFPDMYDPNDYTSINQFTVYNVTDDKVWGTVPFAMDEFRSQALAVTAQVDKALSGNRDKELAVYISYFGTYNHIKVPAMVKHFTEGHATVWLTWGGYPTHGDIRWCVSNDISIKRNFDQWNNMHISYSDYDMDFIGNIETFSEEIYKNGDKIRFPSVGDKLPTIDLSTGYHRIYKMTKVRVGTEYRYKPYIDTSGVVDQATYLEIRDGKIEAVHKVSEFLPPSGGMILQ